MRKVILISPDDTVVHLLKSNSQFLNIEPEVICCSADILNQMKQSSPELLIIDFILNDDNGGTLCHQIKSDNELHDLPIILLSEYTSLDPISAKFGCSNVITKPVNLHELKETINNLLQPQAVH
ncbi:response regulator [Mucilaginibacter lutimaris]|uniref:Response regulator n=1 Tax=Mucilaginibacter lutimaris TaxID=931629 RepID=A0ABW2ZE09_9SPHI